MPHSVSHRWRSAALTVVFAVVLALPGPAAAQTTVGQARAVQATTRSLLGTSTTTLADTGTLEGVGDARNASLTVGSVGSIVGAETLDATTMAWPDQVVSHVSLTSVGVRIGTAVIAADTVIATALAALGGPGTASALVGNLSINGVPVAVTGEPNQRISIPGGQLVINEQTASASGTTVNALHATVAGLADVVIASATAGIQ
jgi:hypothetical protein